MAFNRVIHRFFVSQNGMFCPLLKNLVVRKFDRVAKPASHSLSTFSTSFYDKAYTYAGGGSHSTDS